MPLETRQQFVNLPRMLRETLEEGWLEWGEVIRRTRWGEVPIHIVGSRASFSVGLAGAYAFESLLGWPAVVRTPEEFQAYSQSALRPRSILIVISWEGSAELLELVRAAKARGAPVLALTHDAQSPLAKAVDGVFLARGGEERRDDFTASVCQLTAVHCLALVAARILRRPSAQIEVLEGELRALPEHIEWVLTQLPDAVRSLANELSSLRALAVVAGGLYYPAALLAANALRSLGRLRVQVFTCDEIEALSTEALEPGEVLLALSGSRCRVKKPLHGLIERLHRGGVKVLAVTDHNEPQIARRAALAVLLPNLNEIAGAIVALTFLDWTAYHLTSQRGRKGAPLRGA
jgi:glucosamine--fructose-6-phosphate aminotransferase (isomerizing)